MELTIFDKQNTGTHSRRIGERTVSLNSKNGVVSFSSLAVRELGLKIGSRLILARAKNKSWYLAIVNNSIENAFELRKAGDSMIFRSTGLAKKVSEDFKKQNPVRFLIAKEPQEIDHINYHQIIPYK